MHHACRRLDGCWSLGLVLPLLLGRVFDVEATGARALRGFGWIESLLEIASSVNGRFAFEKVASRSPSGHISRSAVQVTLPRLYCFILASRPQSTKALIARAQLKSPNGSRQL